MVADLDLDLVALLPPPPPSLFLDWLGSREAAGVVAADDEREADDLSWRGASGSAEKCSLSILSKNFETSFVVFSFES